MILLFLLSNFKLINMKLRILPMNCDSNEGTYLSAPLRKGFKPIHLVRTLMYIINIDVLAAFRLSSKKIGNETFSFFIYCRYDTFRFSTSCKKVMNFFVKCDKESNIEHILFCHNPKYYSSYSCDYSFS